MTPAQNTAAYVSGFEDGKRVAIAEIKRELDAQTQRTWVGLTDEEIDLVCVGLWSGGWRKKAMQDFTKAIEAKLKEKNT